MNKVLIVDDSKTISYSLKDLCEEDYGLEVDIAHSMRECAQLLLENKGDYALALLDYNLPDAPNGQVIEFISKFDIKSILLTGSKLEKEDKLLQNPLLIDYVIKEGSYAIEYVSQLINNLLTNSNIEVLIVEDSITFSKKVEELCQKYNLKTIIEPTCKAALSRLVGNHNIKLVLSGYYMKDLDGIEFLTKIRRKYKKDELAFIALSSVEDKDVVANLLRFGANDFLYKDFSEEAFYARVNNSIELIKHIEAAKDKAIKDYMTGMYNRRYLFEYGKELYQKAKQNDDFFSIAILDIDKFKSINDTYGHDIGDIAIKEIPRILKTVLGDEASIFRLGGEEFAVIIPNRLQQEVYYLFEEVREAFENNMIELETFAPLTFTVSIGVTMEFGKSLDEMLRIADENLYQAKRTGRNRVIF